jgi:hypothetical protein
MASAPDSDWFETNFRQVLGIAGTGASSRPLTGPQMLAAIGKRYTKELDRSSRRVTFTRNGEALQLMDDPAEVDPLIATFATSQLGGPRAALATIDADLCVSGSCDGDAGKALVTIREMIDSVIEVSSRRDGGFRTRLLVGQLVGRRPGDAAHPMIEFGLLHCLRRRVAASHRDSPSFAREQALNVLDLAIDALQSFDNGLTLQRGRRSRPLYDVVETLRRCGLHICDGVGDMRRTLAELGIGQCELERARVPGRGRTLITIPDLLSALETLPRDWVRLIDGATPDSQEAIASSAGELSFAVKGLTRDIFVGLFNVGTDAGERLGEAWERFGAYTVSVLDDLGDALDSAPAAVAAREAGRDEALIQAPEEDQTPL